MNTDPTLAAMTRLANEMFSFADRLAAAQRRIAELEAQLAEAAVKVECVTDEQATEGEEVSDDGEG